MKQPHIFDFWVDPKHREIIDEIIGVVNCINKKEKNQRRYAIKKKRKELHEKINNACGKLNAEHISRVYTYIISIMKIELESNKNKQDIWRDLCEGFYPSYPSHSKEIEPFAPNQDDLISLPEGSWLLSLSIKLKKQYTSRSETDFHFSNNPIVRDHLTGLPIVKPTTWKGHLRFAAKKEGIEKNIVYRLFGPNDENGKEEEFKWIGRLRFYPTFFTGSVEQEVVTPLSRDTRTPARGPIGIEVVPAGSTGTFHLLYLPWPRGNGWSQIQIAEDLLEAVKSVKTMFLVYGFSAKKTAGWGIISDTLEKGELITKGRMWPKDDSRKSGRPTEREVIFQIYKVPSVSALVEKAEQIAQSPRKEVVHDRSS